MIGERPRPRLHVLLGAGGVGKTTLAAGFAVALARAGGRVGLLGIDPARRLQGALGLTLVDAPAPVPGAEGLRAALLSPADCLRRWAAETSDDPATLARLQRNTFFVALADRLAASADMLAAIRVAEWAEGDPSLTDLVIDTAPGLNAIDFLKRPQALTAFLEGRLIRGLRALAPAHGGGALAGVLRGGARRAVGGIARLGGTGILLELADFVALVESMLERMLARLESAQRWLRSGSTEILLVTAVRDDAAEGAKKLAEALRDAGLAPRAAVLNRALPEALAEELADIVRSAGGARAGGPERLAPEVAVLAQYARSYIEMQRRVARGIAELAPALVVVPAARGLDEPGRIDALAKVGERLRRGLLDAPPS